jgi:hypothetical protein
MRIAIASLLTATIGNVLAIVPSPSAHHASTVVIVPAMSGSFFSFSST